MASGDSRDRLVLLAYGVFFLIAPAVILAFTLAFLVITGDLVLGRLSLVEFLELYLIDLVIVGAFGYGFYRLTTWIAEHRLPTLLETLAADEQVEIADEESTAEDDR